MSLWRDFALSSILGLRNVYAVLCHLFRCFDPRLKENIHSHPAFIIRDIHSCRKGYSKAVKNPRRVFSWTYRLLLNSITKHSAILTRTFKSQRLPPFNPVTTSCIMKRTLPLNINKDGRMFSGGFWKKAVFYNTYNSDSSSWILKRLVSSSFDKCWYFWWRKRDGKGYYHY